MPARFRMKVSDKRWNDSFDPTTNGLKLLKDQKLEVIDRARNDAKITIDDNAKEISFEYTKKDLDNIHPGFRFLFDETTTPGEFYERYATPEYIQEYEQELSDMREGYRNFNYQDVPDPNIPNQADAKAGARQMLQNSPGFLIGNTHMDKEPKRLVWDLIEEGGNGPNDVKMIFVEEFPEYLQGELDQFLAGKPEDPMPELLKEHVAKEKGSHVDWEPLLRKAQQKGIKIYGVDAGSADAGDALGGVTYERRAGLMNKVAERVMKKAIQDNPGAKFVALLGEEHVNTHVGGIPGLSQMFNVPGVSLDPGRDKLHVLEENKEHRVMPSKVHQAFMEAIFREIKKLEIPMLESDHKEERAVAQKLIQKLQMRGELNDVKEIKNLMGRKLIQDDLAAFKKIKVERSAKVQELTNAIKTGDLHRTKTLLDGDPALLTANMGEEAQALHLACQNAQPTIAKELLDRGASPNVRDKNGLTPLHRACQLKTQDDNVKTNASDVVGHLLGHKDIKIDRADRDGKSGFDMLASSSNPGMVDHFVKKGKGDIKDVFVARYIAEAEKTYYATKTDVQDDFHRPELIAKAKAAAQRLETSGLLVPNADLGTLVKDQAITNEIAGLIDVTQKRRQRKGERDDAISKNDPAALKLVLDADPLLAILPDPNNGNTPLHLACEKGMLKAVNELIKRPGVDLNARNKGGATPLHKACDQHFPDLQVVKEGEEGYDVYKQSMEGAEKVKKQFRAVQKLMLSKKGTDINAKDRDGKTPLHLAAFHNDPGAIEFLLLKKADPNIRDKSGWTPVDTAMISTKPKAEQVFYDKKKATQDPLIANGEHSTVEVLVKATLCQDPAMLEKFRAAYERIYADETMRPMLDLMALSACSKRGSEAGGLRIAVGNGVTTGNLWSDMGNAGSAGAYDEGSHVVHVASLTGKDMRTGKNITNKERDVDELAGILAHELTHAAVHLVTQNDDDVPFASKKEEQEYMDAIQKDVQGLYKLCKDNPNEAFVLDRISGRLNEYVNKGDKALLQEFLVGVPQVAAVFGMDFIEKHAPNLTKYYKDFSGKCSQVAKKDPRFKESRKVVKESKNKALVKVLEKKGAGPKPPLEKDEWLDRSSANLSPDGMAQRLYDAYLLQHGKAKPRTGKDTHTINFQVGDLELDQQQEDEIQKKIAKARVAYQKLLASDRMPKLVNAESIRELTDEALTLIDDPDFQKKLVLKTDTWVKKAKIDFVDRQIALKNIRDLTSFQVAEASVLKTEFEVQSNGAPGIKVSGSDQKKMIGRIQRMLDKKYDDDNPLLDPGTVIKGLSGTMIKNKIIKSKKRFNRDGTKVEVDTGRGKKKWLKELLEIS